MALSSHTMIVTGHHTNNTTGGYGHPQHNGSDMKVYIKWTSKSSNEHVGNYSYTMTVNAEEQAYESLKVWLQNNVGQYDTWEFVGSTDQKWISEWKCKDIINLYWK